MADKNINSSSKKKSPMHSSGKQTKKKFGLSDKKYIAILGISLTILLCTFFVAMGFGFSSYGGHAPTQPPITSEEPEITSDSLTPVDKATGKINILLLGVDVEGLRTDTMIVLSYDLDDNKIKMLSIPRDTRMYIGKKYQKINAAHAITQSGNIKGPQGAIEAVTRLTGIPINYYVEFSFSTFRNTIDSLGGVYFDVPRDMNYEDPVQDLYIHLKKGYQLLDGDKAEQLVRFRRYAMGDLERMEMQQKFISALFEQKLTADTFKNLPSILEQLNNDVNTNLSLSDMIKLIPNLKELSTENITMLSVPGHYNDTDYGASYWIVHMNELAELISTEFEYDASNITIHSSDGKSKSKDSKTSSSSKKQNTSKTSEPEEKTPKPTESNSKTKASDTDTNSKSVQTLSPSIEKKTDVSNNIPENSEPANTPSSANNHKNDTHSAPALKSVDEPNPVSDSMNSNSNEKDKSSETNKTPENNKSENNTSEKTNTVKSDENTSPSEKIPAGNDLPKLDRTEKINSADSSNTDDKPTIINID